MKQLILLFIFIVSAMVYGRTIVDDEVRIGTGVDADVKISADIGLGATNPRFNYNSTTDVWEICNDGVTCVPIVKGDGTSVDETLPRYNGTEGALQGSGISVDDSDNMTGVNDLTTTNDLFVGNSLDVTGSTQIDTNLTVDGTTTLDSTLTGVAKLTAGVVSAGDVDLTSEVGTSVLPIANGGTNSSTALVNDKVIVSSTGSIVESSDIDTTELGYLDGVTSNIQTQLDGKIDTTLTTKGDLLGFSTDYERLGVGTDGQLLAADSAELTGLKWIDPPLVSPTTTIGDLIYNNTGTASGDTRLAIGTEDQILTSKSGIPSWEDLPLETLQDAYNNSTDGAIIADGTRGAVKIQDNDTSIEAPLFQILGNAATAFKKYFEVGLNYIQNAVNTTAERPIVGSAGMQAFNSDEECLEVYNGTEWECVGTGGGGLGANFIVDGSFEKEEYAPTTSGSPVVTYVEYANKANGDPEDDKYYSEFNKKYYRADWSIPFATNLWHRDSISRSGLDGKQGFFSIRIANNAHDDTKLTLCLRFDDPTFAGDCDDNLQVVLENDGEFHDYELPFKFGASSVQYEIFHPAITQDIRIELEEAYIGTTSIMTTSIDRVDVGMTDTTSGICDDNWTNSTVACNYSRLGDKASISWKIDLTGSPSGSALTLSMPQGLTVDESKILPLLSNVKYLGKGSLTNGGTTWYVTARYRLDNNNFDVLLYTADSTYSGVTTVRPTVPFTWESGDELEISMTDIPIQGWSIETSVIVSQKPSSPDKAGFVQLSFAPNNTTPQGFLEADGRCVKRTAWPDYTREVGTTYGACTIDTTDDGVLLPDARGYFFRALDDMGTAQGAASRDVDGTARTVGQTQGDQNKAHTHSHDTGGNNATGIYHQSSNSAEGGFINTGSSGGNEARPKNIAIMAYVRMVNRDYIFGNFKGINSSKLCFVEAQGSSPQTLTGGTTPINFNTVESKDTCNAWDGNTFTANKNMYITAIGSYHDNSSTSANFRVDSYVNGIDPRACSDQVNNNNIRNFNCARMLNEGDTFQVRLSATRTSGGGEQYHHISITQSADYEAIIENFNLGQTMECETKYLQADITTNTTIGDLAFAMAVGEKYSVKLHLKSEGTISDNIGLRVNDNSIIKCEIVNGKNSSITSTGASNLCYFTASTTSLTTESFTLAAGNTIAGNGAISETHVTLCKLPKSTIIKDGN